MKKLFSLIISLSIILVLAACGNSEESSSGNGSNTKQVTIKHELDDTKVDVNPENVVVFDFGVLDTLDKLGIEVAGVPQANIPSYLSKYKDSKYENVGSLKEPDFEALANMGPDLIIISARQMEMYEEFKKIAPTVYLALDYTKYMDSFKENMKVIGQIFDKEKEVEGEVAKIDASINELKNKASSNDKNALIILANDGNISAYGPNSRFGIIHDVFGVKPVDSNIEVSTHGQTISNEYIVEKNPDYLFVIDRGAAVGGESSAKAVVENNLVKETDAYKNGNIVYLSPDFWYLSGGGLVSVQEMVNEISEALK